MRRIGLGTWVAVCAVALATNVAWSGTHENETAGYRIKLPKDFEHQKQASMFGTGISLSDPYILDHFEAEKSMSVSIPEGGSTDYSRRMWTVYFPTRSAAEVAKAREEAKENSGKSSLTVTGGDIFLSFEEWAKQNVSGFYFEEVKDVSFGGKPGRVYEMVFEKLQWVPERWLACSFEIPGGEFGVMFSLPESHFKKFKSECISVARSFQLINDSGMNAQEFDKTVALDDDDDVDESKLDPQQILERRKKQKEEAFAKCRAELPDGWRAMETENYLIAYECAPNYAKKVGKQAEGVREWLAETFAGIGEGYVQSAIIRVYENSGAMPSGFSISMFGGKGRVREFSFGEPTSKGYQNEFNSLNLNVMSNWFSQKNQELWNRMPQWLTTGLREYIEDATLKGSRVVFGMDEWEKDRMNDAKLAQSRYEGPEMGAPFKPIQLLLTRPSDEIFSGQFRGEADAQCASLIRYLIEGPGAKNKKTGRLLETYIANLYDLVEEVEKQIEADRLAGAKKDRKPSSAMSDEERLKAEDEAYRKKRDQAYDKVAKDLLNQVYERTFAGWDERDWKALDSSWMKYAEGRSK